MDIRQSATFKKLKRALTVGSGSSGSNWRAKKEDTVTRQSSAEITIAQESKTEKKEKKKEQKEKKEKKDKKKEQNADVEEEEEAPITNPFLVTQISEDTNGKAPISEPFVVWLEFTEDGIKMLNHPEKKEISIFAFSRVKSYHQGAQQQLWGFEATSKEYPKITRFLFKTKHVEVMGEIKDEFMKKYCVKHNKAEKLKSLEKESSDVKV